MIATTVQMMMTPIGHGRREGIRRKRARNVCVFMTGWLSAVLSIGGGEKSGSILVEGARGLVSPSNPGHPRAGQSAAFSVPSTFLPRIESILEMKESTKKVRRFHGSKMMVSKAERKSRREARKDTGSAGVSSGARNKPPLPPQGEFRPKQSLGQNYLADQNYVMKICNHFGDTSEGGRRVVELGPGTGALTQVLHKRFPDMVAVDIDQRAVELLAKSMPSLSVVLSDVLQVDYTKLAELRGGRLSVIGNLPYHITSQILFTLCDHYKSVRRAVVTMQLEVAQRIVAKPCTKEYGILSVVFQLYTRPKVLFQIPPTVFYPQPSVTSALISLDFKGTGPGVNQSALKSVLSKAFQQRRKMLRQSLKPLLAPGQVLPDKFATRRPGELAPIEFVELTRVVCGESGELPQGTKAWRGQKDRDRDDDEDGHSG